MKTALLATAAAVFFLWPVYSVIDCYFSSWRGAACSSSLGDPAIAVDYGVAPVGRPYLDTWSLGRPKLHPEPLQIIEKLSRSFQVVNVTRGEKFDPRNPLGDAWLALVWVSQQLVARAIVLLFGLVLFVGTRAPPVERAPLVAASVAVEAKCQVCGNEVTGAAFVCPACHTVHHQDCWEYNGGCAIYGCKRARKAVPGAAPEKPKSTA